jgi:hypothetical protein
MNDEMKAIKAEIDRLDAKGKIIDEYGRRHDALCKRWPPKDSDPFLLACYKLLRYSMALKKLKKDLPY